MMIETNCAAAGLTESLKNRQGLDTGYDGETNLFAAYLKEEEVADDNVESVLEEEQDIEYDQDIKEIKEKGLLAFIMEQREQKIREEILASMGLTEEALAEMPPEQRARIEKQIAVEIQKRTMAEALMQKNNSNGSDSVKLEEIAIGTGTIFYKGKT